jgi:hypothetical protein
MRLRYPDEESNLPRTGVSYTDVGRVDCAGLQIFGLWQLADLSSFGDNAFGADLPYCVDYLE